MSAPFKPLIVVLAAGLSRRFNGVKLLAKVKCENGHRPMLQQLLNKLESLEMPVVVATGEYHQLLNTTIISSADFHFCSNASLGLGHTIAQITQYITKSYQGSSHIMFMLADQVAITASDCYSILESSAANPALIQYCQTSDGISAPAIFPTPFWSELIELTGDQGAKTIITNHLEQAMAVEVENAKFDIDQQEQLIQWNDQFRVNHDLTKS